VKITLVAVAVPKDVSTMILSWNARTVVKHTTQTRILRYTAMGVNLQVTQMNWQIGTKMTQRYILFRVGSQVQGEPKALYAFQFSMADNAKDTDLCTITRERNGRHMDEHKSTVITARGRWKNLSQNGWMSAKKQNPTYLALKTMYECAPKTP
jgi:hypothetical protein